MQRQPENHLFPMLTFNLSQVCADLLQVLPLLPGKVPQVSQLQCLYYLLHEGSYSSQAILKI